MQAVLARGQRDFVLEDSAAPTPLDDGAVLNVEAAGVCAADRMLWRGDGPWPITYPFRPGHEIVGKVASIATAAAGRWGVHVGDRIAVEVMVPCDDCPLCREGRENLCRRGTHFGSDRPGAFADQMHLPARSRVHPVPPDLPLGDVAVIETLANAVHAVRRADIHDGHLVAVIGVGAVGSCALKVLHATRPDVTTIAVVAHERAAQRARGLGAHHVLRQPPSTPPGWTEDLGGLGDGYGPHRVIECSGTADGATTALAMVRPGGRICLYGVYPTRVMIDLNAVAEFKELDVTGGHLAPRGAFTAAIDLLASKTVTGVDIVELIALADFRRALDGRGTAPKVALLPGTTEETP